MAASAVFVAFCVLAQPGPELGIDGGNFTLDGRPVFLLGCSYYGGAAVKDSDAVRADLDEMREAGFNWIRVWATWDVFGNGVAVLDDDGRPNKACLRRLKRLCNLAGNRGMVVDVTVSRLNRPCFPGNLEEHTAVVEQLGRTLKRFRNVYFDVGNERNVKGPRHVPMDQVGRLIAAVKAVDPERLCTASNAGGDLALEQAVEYVNTGHVDFLALHRPRKEDTPATTESFTRSVIETLEKSGHVVPVHYQEPFRRDYGRWQPQSGDFVKDLDGARAGGAAGWCFHNGAARKRADGRPRRSFDMRPDEGRLFDQLDSAEMGFIDVLKQRRLNGGESAAAIGNFAVASAGRF